MPLSKVVKVTDDLIYGIWDISEEIASLLDDHKFENHENIDVPTLHPKKQLEYVTSRILIASLCHEAGINYTGLIKDEFGKPELKDNNYHISLSHSFPYAIAIINKKDPVGIDIEYPNEKLKRISSKFLNESEQKYNNNLSDLCKVWCVKETLYKIYGRKKVDYKKHLFVDLGITHDRCIGRFANDFFQKDYQIKIEEYDGFIFTYNF